MTHKPGVSMFSSYELNPSTGFPRTISIRRRPEHPRASRESEIFYWLKQALQSCGFDVIKKLMHKDGHLVSDHVYYVRERKGKFAVWYSQYQIYDIVKQWNTGDEIDLTVEQGGA